MNNHLLRAINLKCDALGCDYEEPVPAITRDLIGKPCPKCGASLLTEQDFASGETMKTYLDVLAAVLPKSKRRTRKGDLLVGMNPHAGELKLSVREVK
jgi:hypothetical protein